MEHFIVSARKYRPQVFADVVGQQAITNTLENAIKSNHLAQALLFTGPRGVGKTTCARILAKRINEESLGTVSEDEDFAYNIFELDAASNNSVDDIRLLTEQVRIPPQIGKYKVYIIDEVHMLSASAFNAFLKTLEEPPAHAIFILATTEKHKIIPTILSRCQIFDFKRIGVLDIKKYLHKIAKEEHIEAEDDALHIIAQKADGALRDALSIFDRVVSFSGKSLTRQAVTENLNVLDYDAYFKVTNLIVSNDIPNILIAYNDILAKGFDGHHFIVGLASHFRDLLVAKDKITADLLEVGDTTKKQYLEQAVKTDIRFLIEAIEKANTCDLQYKTSKNQRLLVELCLMQLASITFISDSSEEKKKSKNYIIPATHFAATIVSEKIDTPIINTVSVVKKEKDSIALKLESESISKEPTIEKNITISPSRRHSALSFKSLQEKKVSTKKVVKVTTNLEDLPKMPFSTEKVQDLWKIYINNLHKKGEKLLASLMGSCNPIANRNTLALVLPNKLMKVDLEKAKPKILRFLREELQNFQVDFDIQVNEEIEKKFAYTPQEKYAYLKDKNQLISVLKNKFDLDL